MSALDPARLRHLGRTDLEIAPVCLGTNVFGWTANETESFEVLDAFVAAGGSMLDTADSYSAFVPGNSGGESETIIGNWIKASGKRDQVLLASKVGRAPGLEGLSPANIERALDASLKRLQTDYVDLYYAHADDPDTPLEETLEAFDDLVRAGKVRYLGASNYGAERLRAALSISERRGSARYEVLQPHYNLVERSHYEGALADLCVAEDVSCMPYFALAKGFLTGKYRSIESTVGTRRAAQASAYLDERGLGVLEALDELAAAHATAPATIALAWLLAQPAVAAPIASARNPGQLTAIIDVLGVELSEEEVAMLATVTADYTQ